VAQTPQAREAEATRLLAAARAAHREADRARARAHKLGARIARRLQHALAAARARIDADRAAIDAKITKYNESLSAFHTEAAADRAARAAAWAELEVRQKRLAADWDETNRFHGDQAAALDARAAELKQREHSEAEARPALQRQVAALREEVAALDARARTAREVVDELERRRADLRAEALAPVPGTEPPAELRVALDRRADRDLSRLAADLDQREQRLDLERAAVQGLFASVSKDKAELGDRRRVLAEQFADLARARARWHAAERATVEEMEQLARTLRRREAELDARQERLIRADARRRADGFDLWQLRLRLEAWQSKIVAYEMRWHTERAAMDADFDRREVALARRELALGPTAATDADPDAVPFALIVPDAAPALPAELVALRDELDRLAEVLLEAELPEPPDPPDSELPWGAEDEVPTAQSAEPDDADVLIFDLPARAA